MTRLASFHRAAIESASGSRLLVGKPAHVRRGRISPASTLRPADRTTQPLGAPALMVSFPDEAMDEHERLGSRGLAGFSIVAPLMTVTLS